MDQITGTIDKIIFKNDENGFAVAYLKSSSIPDGKVTIVGTLPSIQPGEIISCEGEWKHHNKHGRQFIVSSFTLANPTTRKSIQKYLESGMIKGIGKTYAKRIVDTFGTDTLKIIESHPDKLSDVDGIGTKRAEKIQQSFQEQRSVRSVMMFLKSYEIGTVLARKIYRKYGDESIEVMQKDPFIIARELFGVGFKTADKIAKQLGFEVDNPARILAGLEYVLKELSEAGHTCYPEDELIEKASEILEVAIATIQKGIVALEEEGRIIRKEIIIENTPTLCVWLKRLYISEVGIAKEIARLADAPLKIREVKQEKAIEWIQSKLRLSLAKEQINAVLGCLTHPIHIITGGPGTGKSTITKAILGIHEKITSKIVLAAPTGRAAKRMTEITRKKALTIHALLEFDFQNGGFKRGKDLPIVADLIIIDEASMIDSYLMYQLLRAIPDGARVIIIGDIDQLPSVGPGNVLRDLIWSKRIATTRLYQIFRQGPRSKIVYNAHQINRGMFPELPNINDPSDFLFLPEETPEAILEKVLWLTKEMIPQKFGFNAIDDVQVLAPMRRGVIGIENLNEVLQRSLNPGQEFLSRMGRNFSLHDKVMQIRNNYNKMVFNGDIGRITRIDFEDEILHVTFDNKEVEYEATEIDELVLAYSVSIHKYQGSECPAIIIPIHTSHFKLLYRNLLYTGITRGKKLVVLVGSKKAIMMAIRNQEVEKRYSGLAYISTQSIPPLLSNRQELTKSTPS